MVSSDADTAHSDSETDAETDTDLGLDSVDTAHTHTDSSADSRTSIPQKIAPKNPKLRLTYWSLDTALSAIFKGPNPRLGRPSARTKVCSLPSLSHLFIPIHLLNSLCLSYSTPFFLISPTFLLSSHLFLALYLHLCQCLCVCAGGDLSHGNGQARTVRTALSAVLTEDQSFS
jgi:hypothetical protein